MLGPNVLAVQPVRCVGGMVEDAFACMAQRQINIRGYLRLTFDVVSNSLPRPESPQLCSRHPAKTDQLLLADQSQKQVFAIDDL
jgi:hypothetical protein